MEVPGSVSVSAKELFQHCITSCNATISNQIFGQITRKVFRNIKSQSSNGVQKYWGLRPNILEDKSCTQETILEIASTLGYFLMSTENCVSKFGITTGYCTNMNEILKVIEILPDKNYKLSVGGRKINPEEIGLLGLSMRSYLDTKTIFNTFKQCRICQGKSVRSKTDTNKFSVVQEWCQKVNENSLELRCTARKCHGILPLTCKSFICKSCNNLKGTCQPNEKPKPTETYINLQKPTESREDLFKRLFPGVNDLMVTFMKTQSDMSCNESDKRSRRWNKEVIRVCLTLWNRSPEAYSNLRDSGMLILPSERLLSRYKNCLQQTPGINEEMFQWMKSESENSKTEKSGGLIIDEMSIQEDLKMSFKDGTVSIDGLIEMGQFVEDMTILNAHKHEIRTATHVLQFIFLGYDGFRFPIAYYPTAGANASELYDMVWQVINLMSMTFM